MSDTGMQRTANPIKTRKFKDDVIKLRKDVTVNFFDAVNFCYGKANAQFD